MFVSGNGYVGFSFARIWGTAESNWFKLARLSIAESGLHAGEAKLWTFMDMNTRSSTRPPWVWVALALQCVLVLLTGYGCVQMLAYWPRYAASGKAAELVIRVFVPAVMAARLADRALAHQAVGMDPCSDHGRCLMPPGPMVSSGLREVRNPQYGLACI